MSRAALVFVGHNGWDLLQMVECEVCGHRPLNETCYRLSVALLDFFNERAVNSRSVVADCVIGVIDVSSNWWIVLGSTSLNYF